jgi:hypothetical protein
MVDFRFSMENQIDHRPSAIDNRQSNITSTIDHRQSTIDHHFFHQLSKDLPIKLS